MTERYSSPFYTRAFSFTKNKKPRAMGSGSTDHILPLSRGNQHLGKEKVLTLYRSVYLGSKC